MLKQVQHDGIGGWCSKRQRHASESWHLWPMRVAASDPGVRRGDGAQTLDVELEVQHVAVVHDVVLAFLP